jgi:hypothetical protein
MSKLLEVSCMDIFQSSTPRVPVHHIAKASLASSFETSSFKRVVTVESMKVREELVQAHDLNSVLHNLCNI